jgi:hypothetical protein
MFLRLSIPVPEDRALFHYGQSRELVAKAAQSIGDDEFVRYLLWVDETHTPQRTCAVSLYDSAPWAGAGYHCSWTASGRATPGQRAFHLGRTSQGVWDSALRRTPNWHVFDRFRAHADSLPNPSDDYTKTSVRRKIQRGRKRPQKRDSLRDSA